MKNNEVHPAVDEQHDTTQCPLELARQRRWVEDRQEVVLNEAGGVDSPTTLLSKPVFEGRERADQAGELDPRGPSRCGKVYPGDPPPFCDNQASKNDEENEGQMEDNRSVGENTKSHNLNT